MRASTNRLARFHALWTLEGLGSLDASLARQVLKDADAGMRIQAIRATESLYKAGDTSFAADWRAVTEADKDTNVVIQAMLTLQHLKVRPRRTSRPLCEHREPHAASSGWPGGF